MGTPRGGSRGEIAKALSHPNDLVVSVQSLHFVSGY